MCESHNHRVECVQSHGNDKTACFQTDPNLRSLRANTIHMLSFAIFGALLTDNSK